MTTGAVAYMHGYYLGGYILTLGFVITTFGMALWLRDVITEATLLGDHTKEVVVGLVYGIVLFIVSEAFAFLSVFWAFFHSSLSPAIEIGGSWPPLGIEPLNPFAIPLLNTLLLLSSGATITFGRFGPKYLINISQQAICREIRTFHKKNTIQISHKLNFFLIFSYYYYYNYLNEKISACITIYFLNILIVWTIFLVLVKNFFYSYNPQITKARIFKIYKSNITLNCGLSMLVGISEAIRLLFFSCRTFLLLNVIKIYSTCNFIFKNNIIFNSKLMPNFKSIRNNSNKTSNKENIEFNQ